MLQGQVLDVQLRRMARDEMADHVSMFELFTQVKEVAIGEDNPEGVAYVDNLISLWTKMMLDDAVHDDTIAANVRSMQDATIQQISAMQEGLEKMHAFSLERKTLLETCSQAMHAVIMQEKEMKALTSDLRNKKEDMLCKAKMILKREQDRAGKTIHDCQQSLVRLQDDINDKIRETEKKLASTEKAKADALAQLATKKTEEPAPSAGGPGNSWQRGTDNPHDFIFWRICMSFTIHFPRSQYISLFLSLSLSLSWSLGPHVCYHRSARARCLRLSFCLLPPHSPVPCTGMPPPSPHHFVRILPAYRPVLPGGCRASRQAPIREGGVTTHFNRAERAGFGIAQGARDRCATLTLR